MNPRRCPFRVFVVGACLLIPACTSPPLIITPQTLPAAVEGTTYSQPLSADVADAGWQVADGSLPPGLALDETSGQLAGRPTKPGTYTFTVAASVGGLPVRSGSQSFTLTVIQKLRVTFSPTVGRQYEAYDYTPAITGGTPPYQVRINYLPVGIDYDRQTGRIFGTPPVENAGQLLELLVDDSGTTASGSSPQTATARATLVIHPPSVSITSPRDLPAAPIGVAYLYTLGAESGKEPYRWLPTTGALPDGLKLNNDSGEIYNTPLESATTQVFTLSVTDADTPASSAEQEFKIVIPITLLTTTLKDATIGTAYQAVLGAIGGLPFRPPGAVAHYTWKVTSGQLPAGLTLDETRGILAGTPTAAATTQTFTITVSDSDSPAYERASEFTLTVGS